MKAQKILLPIIAVLGAAVFFSVFIVKEVNQAIVLQFGDPKRIIVEPGLNFKIPFIQNIVYLDKRILNLDTPPAEVIAKSDIQPILTEGRAKIEIETQEIIQSILDEYQSGIQVTQVQTQKADPPDQVIDAFRDVQAARADMERSKNEAEAYANDVIPRARGEAAKIMQAAEAYKQKVVAASEGEASRFVSIFNEYDKAKEVTQERMYLETMEKVLADIEKVIIEKGAGSGVVPYLPLPELGKKKVSN